ncbi:superinfection immunity protein [Pseudomonas monteilii]|jgi:hypothetical protein
MSASSDSSMGFFLLLLIVLAYFVPTIVAAKRGHPNGTPIFLLNLFLGWTAIGWLVALIWSFSAVDEIAATPVAQLPAVDSKIDEDRYSRLAKLADLKERGHLTEAEFEAEKSKILSA